MNNYAGLLENSKVLTLHNANMMANNPMTMSKLPMVESIVNYNPYIDKILKIQNIDPIVKSDNKLYHDFFENDKREFYYANSWSYLTQAANGVGKHDFHLGFKYRADDCLITIGIFKSPFSQKIHFHIINPLGKDIVKNVDALARNLYHISGTAVFIKKLEEPVFQKLMTLNNYYSIRENPDKYAWHKTAHLEDDTFPEIILDIDETLGLIENPGKNQVKDKIFRFRNLNIGKVIEWQDLNKENTEHAKALVERFFKFQKLDDIDISTPYDYMNMITENPFGAINQHYLKKLVCIEDEPVAFVCTEKINHTNCHGLYSNLSIHRKSRWISEHVIINTLKFLKELGVKYLNLGGSETSGLDKFKRKFIPREKRESFKVAKNRYWIVYDEK